MEIKKIGIINGGVKESYLKKGEYYLYMTVENMGKYGHELIINSKIKQIPKIISRLEKVKITYNQWIKYIETADEFEYYEILNEITREITNKPKKYSEVTEEKMMSVAVNWGDGEIYGAEGCKDITCIDGPLDKEEFYYTSDIIKVLNFRNNLLIQWNNPIKKKQMIDEYEAS